MKNVWRLITHHQDPSGALAWIRQNNRISVGWSDVGDLRKRDYNTPAEIGAAIRAVKKYCELHNSHLGGASLWNFYAEVGIGDLVILSDKRSSSISGRGRW